MTDSETSSYPVEIAKALREFWAADGYLAAALPADAALVLLIDMMYQASLLREEGESVQCRIIVAPPEAFAPTLAWGAGEVNVLPFAEARALTPHELRKLAAAAGYYRALLAVHVSAMGAPLIWGMVVTGTKWVNRFGGDRFDEAPLPPNLVLQILAPGHLIAASGYTRVLESAGGKLLREGFDPFRSGWLSERFHPLRSALLAELKESLPDSGATRICESFVKDVAQSVFRRVLSLVRTRGHGGMLVLLPTEAGGRAMIDQWLRFRVRFAEDDSALWFHTLLIRLMKRVLELGSALGLAVCTWNDYRRMHDAELAELDDALIGFGHFLADLMSVDGALVLEQYFRLVGFGGEILGENHVAQIHRALDLEAERSIAEAADSSGTRHRAAYRFVNGTRDAIAVVVSQDGDVRFVAHHNGKLVYWPYLP
jgi:hypothetical protein